jgi:hypothetical protein
MAIEVKTRLKRKNVEYHIKRLRQIKEYPPDQYERKKLLEGHSGTYARPGRERPCGRAGHGSRLENGEYSASIQKI